MMVILHCEIGMPGELERVRVWGRGSRAGRLPRAAMLELHPDGDEGVGLETGWVQVLQAEAQMLEVMPFRGLWV